MAKPKSQLEKIRRSLFLNQREVAEKLGVSMQYYSKIERGERGLTLENAKKLKMIFHVNCIDELLEEAK